jgi:holo-[acyl-carrier protein] synthase
VILGLGNDLVAVARVADALQRHGERFMARVLTDAEAELCRRRQDPAVCVAARFAAKEAAAKALATGLRQGVRLTDLEVVRQPGGAPHLQLHGAAAELARSRGVARTHLSLSDEGGFALATVILEDEGV